jgi:hypothetical protein
MNIFDRIPSTLLRGAVVACLLVLALSSARAAEPVFAFEPEGGPADPHRGLSPEELYYHPRSELTYSENWHFMAKLDQGYVIYSNLIITNMGLSQPSCGVEFSILGTDGKQYTSKRDYDKKDLNASTSSYAIQVADNKIGGVLFEFNVPAPCDAIANGNPGMFYILAQRDLIADMIETYVSSQWLDGLVTISSCDKINPAMLMAAARLDLPALCVTGGPNAMGIRFHPDAKARGIDEKGHPDLARGVRGRTDCAGPGRRRDDHRLSRPQARSHDQRREPRPPTRVLASARGSAPQRLPRPLP